MDKFEFPKVRRDVFKVSSIFEPSDDKEYWLSKTPEERLEAVELMRRIIYGDEATKRLQRVLEIVQLLPNGQQKIKRIDLEHLP
ncbi:MAG: hypothetical protein JW804_09555 [Sedimentisphaerales bacterium]|nr:hypothetical protein [Sedimentisphaerales bacterium]